MLVRLMQQRPIPMFRYIEQRAVDLSLKRPRVISTPPVSASFTPVENIAVIAGTQNTASLTQFSRLLYAALHAIQPAALITSADRHRVSTLASQEGVQQTVLVGDSFAAGWNEKCLDVVGMAARREGRATRRCWW